MHYYQHHIGDFIKDTARLSDTQSMAYLRLLWMYYDSEKPLKPDTRILSFQIGVSEVDTQLLLDTFFILCENGWHHTRCDEEIAEYHAYLDKKSNAGRASAERRKNNSSTGVEQVLNSSSTVEQTTTNQQPIIHQDNNEIQTGVEQVLNGCSTAVQLTTNHKPIKNKNIKPDDVSDLIWNEWIKMRKTKKASIGELVLSSYRKEASKINWTLEKVLQECVVRNWQGFKADWIDKQSVQSVKQDWI